MNRPLYIIHGWAYDIAPWDSTVQRLRDAGYDVHQLRVPGLTTPTDHAWDIDNYVQWLDGELTDAEQPIILGHSNGGRIALHYAKLHPQAFSHLILLSSAGVEVASEQLSLKRRVFRLASKILAPLKHVPLARKVVYRLLGSDYGTAPPHMQRTLANMLASDHDFDPSSITTPTSILWGEDDRTTPPAMARKLNKLLPESTLTTIPEWRHAPYRTHPDQLADEIMKILRRQS